MGTYTRFIVCLSFLCYLTQPVCAGTPKKPYRAGDILQGLEDIYHDGTHAVNIEKVTDSTKSICCPLLVAIPVDAGHYPVVQFQHGTQLQNSDYTALISQVASWGFIVVAPQMYSILSWDATFEITNARAILNWMPTGLIASLPLKYAKHRPDFDKVALAGHSRGGLVVFGLALNFGNSVVQQYSAIVALDPVDASWPLAPVILPHEANKMDVGVPTLILGSGLGSRFPACAPEYRGHVNFFKDVTPTSYHFVAPDNGHMDFLDDCKWWHISVRCKSPCWGGPSRQPMRQFSAGAMVAFLQDALLHNNVSLSAALSQSVPAPVRYLAESKVKAR